MTEYYQPGPSTQFRVEAGHRLYLTSTSMEGGEGVNVIMLAISLMRAFLQRFISLSTWNTYRKNCRLSLHHAGPLRVIHDMDLDSLWSPLLYKSWTVR